MVCRVKDRSKFQGLKTAFAPVSLGLTAIGIGASVIRFKKVLRTKLYQHLSYKGFGYDTINSAIRHVLDI